MKPNIILIILDTVRAKNMSCYGYEYNTTPFLNEFSSEGHLFLNAFTPAIWTIPSHASLFTGTYPSQHGALNLHRFLDKKYVTLSKLLSLNGYDSIAFSNNYFISQKEFGLSRGFKSVEESTQKNFLFKKAFYKTLQILFKTNDSGAYITSQMVKKWLAKKIYRKEKPFFLFINFMEAHAPYLRLQKRFLKKYLSPSNIKRLKTINQDRQKYLSRSIEMTHDDFNILRSVYNAQISYLDFVINDLLKFLKKTGISDQSIIIITSDHGDMIGEHNLMHHSYCLYEELIKIPLILKLPGCIENEKIHDNLVSLIDIYPTLIDILQINHPTVDNQLQGINLFDRSNSASREAIYVECEKPKNEFAETYPNFDFSIYDRQLLALRSKKYKFIWSSNNKHELYDLENDPSEINNIFSKEPLLRQNLKEKLFNWYNSFEKASFKNGSNEIELDKKVKEHLKGLGYF